LPNGTLSIAAPPDFLNQPWLDKVPVANHDNDVAQPGSSIIAASVYLGAGSNFQNGFDILYQPNGTNIMESINTDYQNGSFDFSNTILPV